MKKAITQKLMAKLTISLLVPFALILMWSALLTKCNSSCICKQSEIQALLEFKRSLTDKKNYLTSWIGRHCCDWNGLGCEANNNNNNLTCNVVKLDLRAAELEASHLSPALIHLHHLQYLDLSANSFHGSPIPKFIGSITSLKYLNLSSNEFTGKIPHHLGNLTSLQFLDLHFNHDVFFNAEIFQLGPSLELDSWNWVLGLEKLQYLDISWVNTTQASSSLTSVIQKLTYLRTLRLENCELTNSHFPEMLNSSTSSPIQTLDLSGNYLQNPLPHTIMNLTHLSFLDLSSNALSSSIPSWLGSMTSLAHLDLSHNSLNLSIPSWLSSQTTRLEHLDLASNWFSHIEGGIFKLIQGLCGLKYLDLSSNVIEEDLTNSTHVHFTERRSYPLEILHISFNLFRGQLPDCFMKLASLKELFLSYNSISGVIPSSVGNLSSLRGLDLSNNNFSGSIPAFLGGFSSLEYLDLSYNYFHGMINQDHFTNLSGLYYLDLSSNSKLVLMVVDNWLPPFQLHSLNLGSCEIKASFPKWLLTQSDISLLDLSHTGVFGSLPDDLGDRWPSLFSLVLARNHIDGQIPRSLCSMSQLEVLDLGSNRFSATIPDCLGNLPLTNVDLSSNTLSGLIPASLVNLTSIEYLSLNNNTLEGELPYMSNNSFFNLVVMDFGENRLSGKIPPWSKASHPHLIVLKLRTNRLSSEIPESLCSLDNLQVIDLANNGLTGAVPRCIGNLSAMVASPNVHESYNNTYALPSRYFDINDPIVVEVVKGKPFEYTKILRLVVIMDLSNNNLRGKIPTELTKLVSLIGLNLSYNHLTGSIPRKIGTLKNLDSLDLSNNQLSGPIPSSLSELNSLGYLNLSYNQLQGPIPTGRHIQTLNNLSVYLGNPNLCGDILPKKCTTDNNPKDSNEVVVPGTDDDDGHDQRLWLYIPSVLGCVTGFWGIIGVLIVKREWRYAYFQLADDVGNWIYVHAALSITRLGRKAT